MISEQLVCNTPSACSGVVYLAAIGAPDVVEIQLNFAEVLVVNEQRIRARDLLKKVSRQVTDETLR